MLTITDASFGNESNFRSQKGRMTLLSGPDSFGKKRDGRCISLAILRRSWVEFVGIPCKRRRTLLSDGVEEIHATSCRLG